MFHSDMVVDASIGVSSVADGMAYGLDFFDDVLSPMLLPVVYRLLQTNTGGWELKEIEGTPALEAVDIILVEQRHIILALISPPLYVPYLQELPAHAPSHLFLPKTNIFAIEHRDTLLPSNP